MLTSVMLAVAEAQSSVADSLTQNNFLFSCIELLVGAVAVGLAVRLRAKEWKVTAIIAAIGILTTVSYILLSRSSLSALNITKQSLPFLAITAWMLVASYYRHRVNQTVAMRGAAQEARIAEMSAEVRRELAAHGETAKKAEHGLAALIERIASLEKERDEARAQIEELKREREENARQMAAVKEVAEAVQAMFQKETEELIKGPPDIDLASLPEDPLTPIEISRRIQLASSVSPFQHETICKDYRRVKVRWPCKFSRASQMSSNPDFKDYVALSLIYESEHGEEVRIEARVNESKCPGLRALEEDAEIVVIGAIYEASEYRFVLAPAEVEFKLGKKTA